MRSLLQRSPKFPTRLLYPLTPLTPLTRTALPSPLTRPYCTPSSPPPPSPSPPTDLCKVLDKELTDEQAIDRSPPPPLPDGWTLQLHPGKSFFTMSHPAASPAEATLEVFCALPKGNPDAGNTEEPVEQYPFVLRALRHQRTVEFSMLSVENELVVDNIVVYPSARGITDFLSAQTCRELESHYQGPTLAHLDEAVITVLHSYLEGKGVTDKFAVFIKEQCEYIEQGEYERWLRDFKTFAE